jgi:hypothetical protein
MSSGALNWGSGLTMAATVALPESFWLTLSG